MKQGLWERVAEHLGGQSPVMVDWKGTNTDGFAGEVHRDGSQIKMTLVPWMDDNMKLKIFLHECAHIKIEPLEDISNSWMYEQLTTPGGTVFTQEMYEDYAEDPSEKKAWKVSRVWLEYAKHWHYLYPGRTTLEQKLNCLMEY